ncbi:DNA-3-methyladenine glycosylase [Candidatus Endobugula sertula]|uniref:DNA-3-methyladenine glycosylase I n=1 Tax=Candidatus Endobugula sertula TaxID=62101 RepID=A0A1D2QRN4_9GAMM|nr:DNA-3-methyladenine glycosylase [Candidatus Endobugula sertula]
MTKNKNSKRCSWCGTDPDYCDYHDNEWGVPEKDSRALFELLLLEGAQAGLSWITILRKRENYRNAFDHFDPQKMALYSTKKQQALLKNEGIIRNELKVAAFIKNAIAYVNIEKKGGEFSEFLWQFTNDKTRLNRWQSLKEIPVSTPESEAMSKALKKAGFSFVGPTICYAFMQSAGMVNDHTVDCYRYNQLK